MSDRTLGTKQICPDCGAKFYDLGALDVVCPKCDYIFTMDDILEPEVIEVVAPAIKPKKTSAKAEEETEEKAIAPLKEVAMLDSDEDYPDIDHLEEVEDHHEASEVDVNSDDADDEMFMEELDHGDAELLSEFEHIDPDGYRGDEAYF